MELLKGPLTAVLCLCLLGPVPGFAQADPAPADKLPGHPKSRATYQSGQLHGDERILHALNRFTFGPRPGDLEVVRAIGLDAWFEQQLHPESLDLTDLNARLAEYPAMQWSTEDLLFRLPSNAIIRQAINGKYPVPERGVLHVIYENQIERVTAKKQEQDQKKLLAQNQPPAAAMNGSATMAGDAEKTENPTPMAKEPAPAMVASSEPGQGNMAAPENSPVAPSVDQAEIGNVLDLQPDQRVVRLAMMPQPELDAFLKALRPIQRVQLDANLTPEQRQIIAALDNPERLVAEELIAQRLTRDIYSTAQLQEVMTDFWFNHFNIYLRKNETMPYELVSYERDVIRPLALGKFEDLLEATAHSPAMLMYLDNEESIGPDSPNAERAEIAAARRPGNQKKAREGLNENYARELMELHTLGVNGGYTQADVTQVARILTGWTIDRPQRGGGFQFDPNRHEPGTKKALGQKFKDKGEFEGRELLHYLATRPATAQFISRKLAIRFVSDNPPQSLIDRMAKTYLSSGGDISAVLKSLYHSPEFWSADVYRAKVKTPLEYVVSAVRASNANIDNLRPVANALRTMGMPLYGCVPPTGYDWKASSWVSTGALVDRMNFALNLASNHLQGVTASWTPQTNDNSATPFYADPPTAESEETRLEAMIVAGGISDATRAAVLKQFAEQVAQRSDSASAQSVASPPRPVARIAAAPALEREDQLLAGLLLGSPEFQRR
jgi:uncharacterized protein (DUF1800 family)